MTVGVWLKAEASTLHKVPPSLQTVLLSVGKRWELQISTFTGQRLIESCLTPAIVVASVLPRCSRDCSSTPRAVSGYLFSSSACCCVVQGSGLCLLVRATVIVLYLLG